MASSLAAMRYAETRAAQLSGGNFPASDTASEVQAALMERLEQICAAAGITIQELTAAYEHIQRLPADMRQAYLSAPLPPPDADARPRAYGAAINASEMLVMVGASLAFSVLGLFGKRASRNAEPRSPPAGKGAVPEFAAILTRARAAAGLSQVQLAARAGITQSHVSKLERGAWEPRLNTIMGLAKALDINPCKLLPRPDEEATPGDFRE